MTANFQNNDVFTSGNITSSGIITSISGVFSNLTFNGTVVSISGHTHTASSITDFNEAVDDRIGSGLFAAGTGINLSYNDGGNSFTVSVTGLINNPTTNRILTSRDNTSTGIDAESDLTFENKTLNIGSSGNAGAEAIINLYTNDSGDGKPSINFKDNDDNTKLNIYWDDDDNTSSVHSLDDTLVLSGPTNYITINNNGTIGIVSSGVTSNNNFSITNQTANTIASFDANKNVTSLATGTYPSLTELSYVKDVTSAIQTQLNAKQNTLTNPVTGTGIASHVAYWNSSSGIVADSGELYWDATNNRLGIGTSTPSGQLHVIGTGNFSSGLNVGTTGNTGIITGLSTTSTVPALSFQSVTANHTSSSHTIFDFRKNISTRVLYIDGVGSTTIDSSNGNLVVPSTGPSTGNGALIAHGMRRATTTAGMDFAWGESISSASEPGIDLFPIGGTHMVSGILFRLSKNSTKSDVAMIINGSGNVGIGTSAPNAPLHVVGNTNISGVLTATSGSISTLNTVPTFTSPSALGSSQGDWNPGAGDVIRASASVSGVEISGVFLGNEYTRVLINVGTTNNLTLKHQASTATSGYRIITPNGGDYIVQPTGAATILYDIVDNRWRVL